MSLKWVAKDPSSNLDYSVDWGQYLAGSILNNVTWYIYDLDGVKTEVTPGTPIAGLNILGFSNSQTVATVRIAEGVLNRVYKIVCAIEFSDSTQSTERTITLQIREQ